MACKMQRRRVCKTTLTHLEGVGCVRQGVLQTRGVPSAAGAACRAQGCR